MVIGKPVQALRTIGIYVFYFLSWLARIVEKYDPKASQPIEYIYAANDNFIFEEINR